ncbi:MAG TPA: beta-glucosidase, partial [Rhizomicrobium sp.]|nr:beta-glucosidase [Rhizomicrobium sp.]
MTFRSLRSCAAALLLAAAVAHAQPAPWMNTALSPDERASLIQAQMTQDEKFVLVDGWFGKDELVNPNYPPPPPEIRSVLPHAAGYIPGIPRLGIPPQLETDASLGVANGGHMRPGDTSTALPASILTASSWNPKLAYDVGAVVGRETRDKGFDVLLDGGVDLARDPRNGRNFEYAGEDPLLAGTIVGEAIRGAQDQHIISTAKHYAVNDQEIGRDWLSSNIDEKAMRESDLLAFEIAIEEGDPGSIMCAYNRVNGVYSCENDFLLDKVLKGDWKYPGYVMSDWGGVHSTVDAAMHGLDQESAFVFDRDHYFGDKLKAALASGQVPQARLDDMVHRILRSMFAKGLFDYPLKARPIDVKADLDVAQRAAEEGIVLLKNANNLLPLTAKARRIAVIGGRADVGVLSGGGSSQVIPVGNDPSTQEFLVPRGVGERAERDAHLRFETMVYDPPSPLSAIKAEAKGARVTYDDGSDPGKAAALAARSDVVIVFAEKWQREGTDALSISLPGGQDALIAAVAKANPRTVVVLETGNPVAMPWLDGVGGVLEAWYPGNRGAAALARILFGKVNPSGRLPISFPQSDAQLPRPVIPGKDFVQPHNRWQGGEVLFDVDYKEGANAGYKWYATQKLEPLFPFGFGLSYTTFGYSGLSATAGTAATGTAPSVTFDVKNTGKRAGKAVAQIYVTPPAGAIRLVAFQKVELGAGGMVRMKLLVDRRVLASFDTTANVWRVAGGDYVFTLGASSADVSATATLHLEAATIK